MSVVDRMEDCARLAHGTADAARPGWRAGLADPDWRVRYASIGAIEDLADAQAIPALLALLSAEDAEPLYGQRGHTWGIGAGEPRGRVQLPADLPEATRRAWERRGRLKQAACFALGAIGRADPAVLAALHRYAVDAAEDYLVRAAANHALGCIASPASRAVLKQATRDEEWCTATEARKALRQLERTGTA